MLRFLISSVIILVVLNVVVSENGELAVVEEFRSQDENEFNWRYKLSDGREISESGSKKTLDDGREVLTVNGFYSYTGPDGKKYTVHFDADENGYHPRVVVGDLPSKSKVVPVTSPRPIPRPSRPPTTYRPFDESPKDVPESIDLKLLHILAG